MNSTPHLWVKLDWVLIAPRRLFITSKRQTFLLHIFCCEKRLSVYSLFDILVMFLWGLDLDRSSVPASYLLLPRGIVPCLHVRLKHWSLALKANIHLFVFISCSKNVVHSFFVSQGFPFHDYELYYQGGVCSHFCEFQVEGENFPSQFSLLLTASSTNRFVGLCR